MPATFAVTAEPARHLVRITLTGFFGAADFAGYLAARAEAQTQLTCGPNEHDVLVDVGGLALQAQAMVEAFRGLITNPATRARRLAFVTGEAAVRMQVRRLLYSGRVRCFATLAEAERWLASPLDEVQLAG